MRSAYLAALLLLAACGGDVHLAQEVFEVKVHTTGDCPAAATAHITLGIGACDRVLAPEVERRTGEIAVKPWVSTSDDTCISILLFHELTVPLGRYRAGTYRVVVESEFGPAERTFIVPDSCQ